MTADYGRPIEDFSIVNVMLPRRYHPPLAGNLYERRAADVAAQLCGPDLVLDYDQLVAKPPRKTDAVFHWHQDLAYWPVTPDTRTASFWLALDEADLDNGCVQFVSGSHREPGCARTRRCTATARRATRWWPRWTPGTRRSRRGCTRATSPCTTSARCTARAATRATAGGAATWWRSAPQETIAAERALGFTHSHKDGCEVLRGVGREA